MKVLNQTEYLVVVEKPAGVLTVPARFADDPRPVLGKRLEKQMGLRLWPVHRLDFEVSGVVIFAKSPMAQRVLSKLFEGRMVRKTYHAQTETGPGIGALSAPPFIWKDQILRGKKRAFASAHGLWAETQVMSVKSGPRGLDWVLRPITGRPHQLRYQLASRGFPIIGDALYGSGIAFEPNGIALRAVTLEALIDVPEIGLRAGTCWGSSG